MSDCYHNTFTEYGGLGRCTSCGAQGVVIRTLVSITNSLDITAVRLDTQGGQPNS